MFCAGGDACFCSKQHIFTTQPKAAVSNGLLRPVHSFCYFYYCLPYSFHFSYWGERERERERERAHSIPFKYVLSLKEAGSEWPHIPPRSHSLHHLPSSVPSLFLVGLTDFVGCQEETNKGLSTDSTIIQVGQLHNNFSSIHHRASLACCLVQPLGTSGYSWIGRPESL